MEKGHIYRLFPLTGISPFIGRKVANPDISHVYWLACINEYHDLKSKMLTAFDCAISAQGIKSLNANEIPQNQCVDGIL